MAKVYILVPAEKEGNEYNLRMYKRKKDAVAMAKWLVERDGSDKELVVDVKRGGGLGFVYKRGELYKGYEIITRDLM